MSYSTSFSRSECLVSAHNICNIHILFHCSFLWLPGSCAPRARVVEHVYFVAWLCTDKYKKQPGIANRFWLWWRPFAATGIVTLGLALLFISEWTSSLTLFCWMQTKLAYRFMSGRRGKDLHSDCIISIRFGRAEIVEKHGNTSCAHWWLSFHSTVYTQQKTFRHLTGNMMSNLIHHLFTIDDTFFFCQ